MCELMPVDDAQSADSNGSVFHAPFRFHSGSIPVSLQRRNASIMNGGRIDPDPELCGTHSNCMDYVTLQSIMDAS